MEDAGPRGSDGMRGAPGTAGRWTVGSSSNADGGRDAKLGSGRPVVIGGGPSDSARGSSPPCFTRLCSFQHAGQRHSILKFPSGVRVRVSRQPNWELMRV